jgi:3D (Asp-Asp-Asp) domain-containing protein
MGTRFLLIITGFVLLFAASAFAAENSLLARITVYWPGEGQVRACSNGVRLRNGHCAVDPKRIPYGSHVIFPDADCVAVDSGPGVVNRMAARACGRTLAQRNAIVIDRFFESKEAALSWSRAHSQFMTVRVVEPGSSGESKTTVVETRIARTRTTALPKAKKLQPRVTADGMELGVPDEARSNQPKVL